MKSEEQLKAEKRELEILEVVFKNEDEEHLREITFQQYLQKIGKQNLGKQEVEEEVEKAELTRKQKEEFCQYENEYLSSGGIKTFEEWKKIMEDKND